MKEIENAMNELTSLLNAGISGMDLEMFGTVSENSFKLAISALEKQVPLKLEYKSGFGYCSCGCEFESEGYSGEEFCPECGQKVWVGGYNGNIQSNIVKFK